MENGVIIINKEKGMTSQTVVNKLKSILNIKKAGHTGTLDPMAEGVLPVLVGRGVKASEFMLSSDKHYIATLTLGITTDTEDTTGNILSVSDSIPDEKTVLDTVKSFVGNIKQTPPMYSALKVGGQKLCDLARRGETVEREARDITVFSLDAKKIDEKNYTLTVHCSKGTYIRTLCSDIGKALGCGGAMSSLVRSESAGFTLSDTITLGELTELGAGARDKIIPLERVFDKYPAVKLTSFFARLARNGLEISQKKLGISISEGTLLRLYDGKTFFALGRAAIKDAEPTVKPIKQFEI